MRRAAKIDLTHKSIVAALREAGISVHPGTAIGGGFPDAIASYAGFTALVEAKTPGGKGLNKAQRDFAEGWQGVIIVAKSPDEACKKFFEEYARRK